MKKFFIIGLLFCLILSGCTNQEAPEISDSSGEEISGEIIGEEMDEVSEIEEESEAPPVPLETFEFEEGEAIAALVPDETGNIPIFDRKELAAIAEIINSGDQSLDGQTFVLQNDLNLTGYDFVPIGGGSNEFNATFDGGGNLISGLTIRDKGFPEGTGLFGIIGENGTVKNLHITNGNIKGNNKTGGVAGWNKGTIYNCSFRGKVQSSSAQAGGIAGANGVPGSGGQQAPRIEASFCNAEVLGAEEVGTFAGSNCAEISNSYALGSACAVAGEEIDEPGQIGGFAGSNSGAVSCCFSSADVYTKVSARVVGGFIGYNEMDVRACYYNQTATSNWKGIGVDDAQQPVNLTGCTVEELVDGATYEGWDFSTVWVIDGEKNRGLPYLQTAGL